MRVGFVADAAGRKPHAGAHRRRGAGLMRRAASTAMKSAKATAVAWSERCVLSERERRVQGLSNSVVAVLWHITPPTSDPPATVAFWPRTVRAAPDHHRHDDTRDGSVDSVR
ncbi:hypothetical protein EVAR_77536_1 [Eumeta japonica]|uniref:Uncharacterized protein n=1 Tax=Eumeta variegata TaxID=151549 RepID=A0A4C1T9M2_EUMVA|nr:hypothetical protein EVAR_77536_1 [Eumeta japonica]